MPKLFIISGPSGVGKGTVIRGVMKALSTVRLAVSATTRTPRAGEENGVHYYFLSDIEFTHAVDNQEFIEWCQVFDHRYGTLRKEVEQIQATGYDVLLEIDVQGAQKVKQSLPGAIGIFIAPPDPKVLHERLKKRATEAEAVMHRRLAVASDELAAQHFYDHVVVNDDQDHAVHEVVQIINKRSVPENETSSKNS